MTATSNGKHDAPTALDFARSYARAGLSVLPIKTDGTKKPLGKWKIWQERIATPAEIDQLFINGVGVAIVNGAVSGNKELIDLDVPDLVEPFEALVRKLSPGLLERLPTVATPRNNHGGRQYHYRIAAAVSGNTKLAMSELRPQFNEDGTPDVARLP